MILVHYSTYNNIANHWNFHFLLPTDPIKHKEVVNIFKNSVYLCSVSRYTYISKTNFRMIVAAPMCHYLSLGNNHNNTVSAAPTRIWEYWDLSQRSTRSKWISREPHCPRWWLQWKPCWAPQRERSRPRQTDRQTHWKSLSREGGRQILA